MTDSNMKILILLLCVFCFAIEAGADTFSVRVNASSDDAEESIELSNQMDLLSSDLELLFEVDSTPASGQWVGMRFTNVTIPKGAVINNAHVQFATDETGTNSTSVTIAGEAVDDATTFTSTAGNISGRTLTTASVSWSSIPAWNTLQEAGVNQRTPNIASIIQEIVNRPGWVSGNDINIIFHSGNGGTRTAEAYDGSPSEAPLLFVDYSVERRIW